MSSLPHVVEMQSGPALPGRSGNLLVQNLAPSNNCWFTNDRGTHVLLPASGAGSPITMFDRQALTSMGLIETLGRTLRSSLLLRSCMLMLCAGLYALAMKSQPHAAPVPAAPLQSQLYLQPFPLDHVQLKPDSYLYKAAALNQEYLLMLRHEELLFSFRQNAGLPTADAAPMGGWESPACEVRGQFIGHYLSGTAMLWRQTGNAELKQQMDLVVKELRTVQIALGGGYLSAFPTSHFDRLEALQPVWAPYYVIHKIMAGLLDQHTFAGSALALQCVIEMAGYFVRRVDAVVQAQGMEHWGGILNNEFGGMQEVLTNLYRVSLDPDHLRLADLFVKPTFYNPLQAGQDPLAGLHANTHLAQVNSFAARHEATGDAAQRTVAAHFFDVVTGHHSFATGGSNDHEFWGPADMMADAVFQQVHAQETEETCTVYNMLKLARYLFRWTNDPRYSDYYEQAMLNGLLGTQRMPRDYSPPAAALQRLPAASVASDPPSGAGSILARPGSEAWPLEAANASVLDVSAAAVSQVLPDWRAEAFRRFTPGGSRSGKANAGADPGPGVLLYLKPVGRGNTKGDNSHGWGTPHDSFWCCYGSSVESFGKTTDSIFFHRPATATTPAELYINQMASSTLLWPQQRLRVDLDSDLDAALGDAVTMRVSFTAINSSGGGRSGPPAAPAATAALPSHAAAGGVARVRSLLGGSAADPAAPVSLVKLRVPGWVEPQGSEVTLNGQLWQACTPLQPGTLCTVQGAFTTGDTIEARFRMRVWAEQVQDARALFAPLKAIHMGPFLMAGLTHDTRKIAADVGALPSMLSVVSSEGLVSLRLRGSQDRYLQHAGGSVSVGPVVGTDLEATFRLTKLPASSEALQAATSTEDSATSGSIVLESAVLPGHIVTTLRGGLQLVQHWPQLHGCSMPPQQHTLSSGGGAAAVTLSAFNGTDGFGGEQLMLDVVPALGAYPQGTRLLSGSDRLYVVVPLKNIVEERYTSYFEFTLPEQ